METNAVPVDLTQTWDEARNVDGEDSSIVFTPPESDGHGGYVDNDGNPVDEFGRDIPQPDGNGGWVNHEGEPVTEEGAPLPAADGSIPAPDLGDWKVSTGDIRDAEDRILTLTKTEIDQFESFRDSVMQRASWIFYAENYADTQVSRHSGDRIQATTTPRGATARTSTTRVSRTRTRSRPSRFSTTSISCCNPWVAYSNWSASTSPNSITPRRSTPRPTSTPRLPPTEPLTGPTSRGSRRRRPACARPRRPAHRRGSRPAQAGHRKWHCRNAKPLRSADIVPE